MLYKAGYFPMADQCNKISWHFPEPRAIFDIYNTKIHRNVQKLYNSGKFHFRIDHNFHQVIMNCANRKETWINDAIIDVFLEIHDMGFAHSVEVYDQDDKLVGGLYGLAIGAAFFGESMFNLVPNAAKLAFAKLLEILRKNNYLLLDSQYINHFTAQLGAYEIHSLKYLQLLNFAVKLERNFED